MMQRFRPPTLRRPGEITMPTFDEAGQRTISEMAPPPVADLPPVSSLTVPSSALSGPSNYDMPPAQGGFMEGPHPSFKQRLKAALPNIITSAIAAGATPSHYGGGALDIFQGLQAGQAAVKAKQDEAYNRQRQIAIDAQNASENQMRQRVQQAQLEDYLAQAEDRRQQAAARTAQKTEQQLTDAWAKETDPVKKAAAWDALMQWKHGITKPEKPQATWRAMPGGQGTYNEATGERKFDSDPAAAVRLKTGRDLYGVVYGITPDMTDAQAFAKFPPALQHDIMFGREEPKPGALPSNPEAVIIGPPAGPIDPRTGLPTYTSKQISDAERLARLNHPPHEQSAAELDHAEKRRVTDQAGRIWAGTVDWMKQNGKPLDADSVLQLAVHNAATYFPGEQNVGGVVAALQGIARTQSLTTKTAKGGGSILGIGAGGTNPQATTATGGRGNPQAPKPDPGPPPAVLQNLRPGTSRLRNGDVYYKDPMTGMVSQIDEATGKVLRTF
jgi:hypothetical protein